MKLEITKVSVSKKGTVWIQGKALYASEDLKEGDTFDCTISDEKEEPKDDKASDTV